jgi:TonB-linked SusC/RagA family outer membrane protein
MSEKTKNVRYALVAMLLLFCSAIQAQTVSGNVKDPTGEPIIGATVMEQGTQNGTVTDFDGNFTITLKGKSHKLVFSYVGMVNQTVDVAGKSSVNVAMKDDAQMLDEVVAIGYTTVRKRDLTGAVSQVSAKQIEDIPVSNVTEALTGKMAGVNVTTTEGSPDADITIRVRGGGSLSQDNSPLYIVDGFEVSSINDIASSDIETIDVLKDAASTAIYGARGANGVVIVTTKSGKAGKVNVNFNASIGWKKVTKEIPVMDPYNLGRSRKNFF